jgi:hypothetical protein
MTYTFKLSRRLAISKYATLVAAAVVMTACNNDATAPDAGPLAPTTALSIRVVPSLVTVETNQKIRFRGEGPDHGHEALTTPIVWESTGGVINAAGDFSAITPGTYKVVGRGHGRQKPDTGTVIVVSPPPSVVRVSLTPGSVTVLAGATAAFTASGILTDGSTAAIGVVWQASGGTIDPSGLFSAGDVAGTYRVIASNTAGTLADTSSVVISAPTPAPTPAPTLAQVYLSPASVTLAAGATKQFSAYGKNSVGDSVNVTVSFTTTGGTTSGTGLYTAGATAGSYRVIASAAGKADTSAVTVTVTTPPVTTPPVTTPPVAGGLYLGPFNASVPTSPVTMYLNAQSPSQLKTQLAAARAGGYRIFAITAGGNHAQYLDASGHWSFGLWKPMGVDRYRADSLVWQSYANDGTLLGLSLIDEPQCAACWGGQVIPWVLVDSAAKLSKQVFRGVPHYTRTDATQFNGYPFKHLDGGMLQYGQEKGAVATWTANQIAVAKANGYALMVGVNAARGGKVVTGCFPSPVSSTACAMSAAELTTYFTTLAADNSVVCGLTAWGPNAAWWDSYLASSGVRSAMAGVATWAKGRAAPNCLKR